MKRIFTFAAVLTVAALVLGAFDVTATGNGAPSGPHYNLNIIGVPKNKTADMTGGHRIFVGLGSSGSVSNTKIMLTEGDFQVLDGNGTDGVAAFQLPNPDPNNDGITEYSVWARAVGKPGGTAEIVTCATDPVSGEEICSTLSKVFVRSKGKPTFENVSKELLYIYYDLDGNNVPERYPLFDPALEDYFWNYDNQGLKVLQLRFYEVPTNVN